MEQTAFGGIASTKPTEPQMVFHAALIVGAFCFSDLRRTGGWGVDEYEVDGHPGYRAFVEWWRGQCFQTMEDARTAYKDRGARRCQ